MGSLIQFMTIVLNRTKGRKDYPKNANGLKQAIATRPVLMKAAIAVHLKMIECRGINIFKQVELAMKWKTIHTSSIQGR